MRNKGRNIKELYPFPTFRPGHEELLEYVENHKNDYDVMIIVAPVASGKTAIRRTIASFYGDSCMLVPTNALIHQELEEFPQTRCIMSRDAGDYESDFQYSQAIASVSQRGAPILCVPHMMLARRLQRRTLICDEGHRMVDFNQELQSTHAWRKDIGFPITTYSRRDFEHFLRLRRGEDESRKLLDKLATDDYLVKREKAALRGKLEDRIRLIPMSPALHPSIGSCGRIILLSATINSLDLKDMGIGEDKRVVKIELPSAIPADRRPLVKAYVGSLSQRNLSSMAPFIALRIKALADYHSGVKGLVHVTYQLSNFLRPFLSDSKFIFHGQGDDSKRALGAWMQSRDSVFIAAGFSEGLDLKGSAYEWQAIAKVQYPSLGDSAIAKKAKESDAWYTWQALREVIQAYGRICRGPEDFGVTYILDRSFDGLIQRARSHGLIPTFFKEALDAES